MLDLAVYKIILERSSSAPSIDQEGCRSPILWRLRTSWTLNSVKSRRCIHLVPQNCEILRGTDDDAVSESITIKGVIGNGGGPYGTIRIVGPR